MKQSIRVNSPEETLQVSESLAARLKPGSVVALIGELGAGKTLFAKGLCRGLGYQGEVTSPSYVHVHQYRGRMTIHHVDFYRNRNASDVWSLGLEESLGEDGVTLIEWADRFPELLPEDCWQVRISSIRDNPRGRLIEIFPPSTT